MIPTQKANTSRIRLYIFAGLAVVLAVCAVRLHATNAALYYQMTFARLTQIDQQAVQEGAAYLIDDPQKAIRTAQLWALGHGVELDEISFIRTGQSGRSLGMGINRRIPTYIAMLAYGLPNRTVSVAAWANWQDPSHPEGSKPRLVAAR